VFLLADMFLNQLLQCLFRSCHFLCNDLVILTAELFTYLVSEFARITEQLASHVTPAVQVTYMSPCVCHLVYVTLCLQVLNYSASTYYYNLLPRDF